MELGKLGWFALIILCILVFLVVNNSKGTAQVIQALSGGATQLAQTLQGRGGSTTGPTVSPVSFDPTGGGGTIFA